MKKGTIFLVFLMCFVCYQGFSLGALEALFGRNKVGNDPVTPLPGDPRLGDAEYNAIINRLDDIRRNLGQTGEGTVPPRPQETIQVTPQILSILRQIPDTPLTQMKFFLSENFELEIEQNSAANAPQYRYDDALIFPSNTPSERRVRSERYRTDDPGRYLDQGENWNVLLFEFQGKPSLKFRRNSQGYYELYSFRLLNDDIPIRLRAGEHPLLTIVVRGRPETVIESRNVSADITPRDPDFSETQPPYTGGRSGSNQIIGDGSSTVNKIVSHIIARSRGRAVLNESQIRSLITLYINEARAEEVNYDIAIAQMLYNTAFLTSVVANNYGGLSNCRFNDRETGVRAHIQHLRGYARTNLILSGNRQRVDPRWNAISNFRGTIQDLDGLCRRWFPNNPQNYRYNITLILGMIR